MSATYSVKEISENHNLTRYIVRYRFKTLKIHPIFRREGKKTKLYTQTQIDKILNLRQSKKDMQVKIPEVIYITIAPSDVYHSRMNYDKTL